MWFKQGLKDRLGALAGACYYIAAADGDVSAQEIRSMAETIRLLAEREVDLHEVERLLVEAQREIAARGADAYLSGIGEGLGREGVTQLLGAAAYTIFADGRMSPDEHTAYLALARAVGKPEPAAEAILHTLQAGLEEPAEVEAAPVDSDAD